MAENKTFPKLDGWVRATDVADRIGVSRQRINKMIHDPQGPFTSVRTLGDDDRRPLYVIAQEEVDAVIAARSEKAKASAE